MVLTEKVEVREHKLYGFKCKGIFANSLIKKGEWIWMWDEANEELRTYHKADVDEAPARDRDNLIMYSYMLDDDVYGSTPNPDEDVSYFFNHSCAPNCCYKTDKYLVAMRDIQPNEHVVYDYAFTETEASLHAGLHCKCSTPQCRKILTFSDWRSAEWRTKYRDMVTDYIARKMSENGWYDSRIVMRYKSDEEKGLFATAPIRRGELILVFTGKVVGLEELQKSDQRTQELSLQVNDSLWQIPTGAGPETSDYVNHCCDASCGMEDSTTVVALRDIAAGDEITIDYATVNSGAISADSDNFKCRCGASTCRRTVSSTDWRLPEVQQRYWPYFPPFVKRLILKHYYTTITNNGSKALELEPIAIPVPNF